nr:MAG TPA: Putative exonuclease [Caudoviricetes sp.]
MDRLDKDNYFSNVMAAKYMSVSQFKAFEKCPAAAMAEMKGEYVKEKTPALLLGLYVDAYFEGSSERFREENPEVFRLDGGLRSEYRHAEEMIKRLEKDRFFMTFMSGKKQVIMTGDIGGVSVKIKIDVLHDDKIVDLKIMRDFLPVYLPEQGRLPWFEAWRYDLQGAVYQEIVRQNTGKKLPFYLAAATKEKIPDLGIFLIEQDLLDFELEKFKEKVQYYDAIKKGVIEPERCEKCDYCKMTKVLTKIIKSGELYDE